MTEFQEHLLDEIRMNLASIKRVDPYANKIVDTAAHVAFYTYNVDNSEWEKTEIEGAFFIYKRNAEPYHSIFINNRLNTNSLVEPITAHLELQIQPPFLLYRNERKSIRGLWFYEEDICTRIGTTVQTIIDYNSQIQKTKEQQQQQQQPQQQKSNINILKSNSNIDIYAMLSKAQNDYLKEQELDNEQQQQRKHQENGTSIIDQFNKLFVNNNNLSDLTSPSVMNFFAAVAQPSSPVVQKPAASAIEVPFFQRLLSNSSVHVDQIEKHQKSVTPQDMRRYTPQ